MTYWVPRAAPFGALSMFAGFCRVGAALKAMAPGLKRTLSGKRHTMVVHLHYISEGT